MIGWFVLKGGSYSQNYGGGKVSECFISLLKHYILQALASAQIEVSCVFVFSDVGCWFILKGGSYSQNYGGGKVSERFTSLYVAPYKL